MKCIGYADPLRAGRHPFQTYMLALCLVSGLPLLFRPPAAGSIEETLPPWAGMVWGASLTIGAGAALVGCYLPRSTYATALTLERTGLSVTGSAAVVYAIIIWLNIGLDGLIATGIILGFGVSCLIRSHHIGGVIVRAIQTISDDEDEPPRVQTEQEADAPPGDDSQGRGV